MKITRDGIQLCGDCMIVAVNGDYSGFDYQMNGRGPKAEAKRDARIAEVDAGLASLGPHLVPSFDVEADKGYDEFSTRPCECCGTKLHGSRFEFSILGE